MSFCTYPGVEGQELGLNIFCLLSSWPPLTVNIRQQTQTYLTIAHGYISMKNLNKLLIINSLYIVRHSNGQFTILIGKFKEGYACCSCTLIKQLGLHFNFTCMHR